MSSPCLLPPVLCGAPIEHIDFDAIVQRFLFDTDFLMGATLLSAEEAVPGQARVLRQAWRIAARAGSLQRRAR